MLDCAARGEQFDGLTGLRSPAGPVAPAGVERLTIRAAVLRYLLTEHEWRVDPKGVRLSRVRITGLLDLEGVTVRCPLLLDDCDLDDPSPLTVDSATMPLMVLSRCRLAGISGDSVTIAGAAPHGPAVRYRVSMWQTNGDHWFGWAWVLGTWVATACGWFLATLLVVGYSGLAKQG